MHTNYCNLLDTIDSQPKSICSRLFQGTMTRLSPAEVFDLINENTISILLSQSFFESISNTPLCSGPGTSPLSAFAGSTSSSVGCVLDLAEYRDTLLAKHILESRLFIGLLDDFLDSIGLLLTSNKIKSVWLMVCLPLLIVLIDLVWLLIFWHRHKTYKRAIMMVLHAPTQALFRNSTLMTIMHEGKL